MNNFEQFVRAGLQAVRDRLADKADESVARRFVVWWLALGQWDVAAATGEPGRRTVTHRDVIRGTAVACGLSTGTVRAIFKQAKKMVLDPLLEAGTPLESAMTGWTVAGHSLLGDRERAEALTMQVFPRHVGQLVAGGECDDAEAEFFGAALLDWLAKPENTIPFTLGDGSGTALDAKGDVPKSVAATVAGTLTGLLALISSAAAGVFLSWFSDAFRQVSGEKTRVKDIARSLARKAAGRLPKAERAAAVQAIVAGVIKSGAVEEHLSAIRAALRGMSESDRRQVCLPTKGARVLVLGYTMSLKGARPKSSPQEGKVIRVDPYGLDLRVSVSMPDRSTLCAWIYDFRPALTDTGQPYFTLDMRDRSGNR